VSPEITSALVAGVVALVVALLSAWFASLRFKREFALEFRTETLLRRLLSDPRWRLRTFKTIKHHVAGFEDDDLRRTLIRAGAVRFSDDSGVEIWGLLERTADLLDHEYGTKQN